MKIHIARLYYPVTTLGSGKRCVIWTTGCPRKCEGCVSDELRSLEYGNAVEVAEIVRFIQKKMPTPDGFTISGGDPFYQLDALAELTTALREISKDIIVYTGYTYKELKDMNDQRIEDVFNNISVLIDGPYISGLDDGLGIRGSANQNYICMDPEYDMSQITKQKRSVQMVIYGESMLQIGVPRGKR